MATQFNQILGSDSSWLGLFLEPGLRATDIVTAGDSVPADTGLATLGLHYILE